MFSQLKVSAVTICLILGFAACDGDDSGSSSSGSAPSSIISYKLVQFVDSSSADPGISVVQRGDTVEYNFIDSTTIQGAGLDVYPTTSWSYSASGSSATVRLNYSNGSSVESLNFTSSTGGTYSSVSTLSGSGLQGRHNGTFTVSGGSQDSSGSGGGNDCSGMGEVVVYTTDSSPGTISVSIDGSSIGTLTQYWSSGAPTCGDAAAITRTLNVGTHSLSASSSGGGSWGPSNFSIVECGCLTFALNP